MSLTLRVETASYTLIVAAQGGRAGEEPAVAVTSTAAVVAMKVPEPPREVTIEAKG